MGADAQFFATVALVGLAAALAFVWGVPWLRGVGYREEVRRLVCPERGGLVTVTLVQFRRDAPWTGPKQCSAFGDPDRVDCDRTCIRTMNQQDGRND